MCVKLGGVNTVPYQPIYTVPTNKLVRLTPLFRTEKNTGRTDQFWAIPADIRKKVFFYYYYFLSFVIFEFLLGQNGNLFTLIY